MYRYRAPGTCIRPNRALSAHRIWNLCLQGTSSRRSKTTGHSTFRHRNRLQTLCRWTSDRTKGSPRQKSGNPCPGCRSGGLPDPCGFAGDRGQAGSLQLQLSQRRHLESHHDWFGAGHNAKELEGQFSTNATGGHPSYHGPVSLWLLFDPQAGNITVLF